MKKVLNVSLTSVLVVAMVSACAPAKRSLTKTAPAGPQATANNKTDPALLPQSEPKPMTATNTTVDQIKAQTKVTVSGTNVKLTKVESAVTSATNPLDHWLVTNVTFSDGKVFEAGARPDVDASGKLLNEVDGSAKLQVKGSSTDTTAVCLQKSADLSKGIEGCSDLKFNASLTLTDDKGNSRLAVLTIEVQQKSNSATTFELKAPGSTATADASGDFGIATVESSQAVLFDYEALKNNDQTKEVIDSKKFINIRLQSLKDAAPVKAFNAKNQGAIVGALEVIGFPAQMKTGNVKALGSDAEIASSGSLISLAIPVQVADKTTETLTLTIDGSKTVTSDQAQSPAPSIAPATIQNDQTTNVEKATQGEQASADPSNADQASSANKASESSNGTKAQDQQNGQQPTQNSQGQAGSQKAQEQRSQAAQQNQTTQQPKTAQQPVVKTQSRSTKTIALNPVVRQQRAETKSASVSVETSTSKSNSSAATSIVTADSQQPAPAPAPKNRLTKAVQTVKAEAAVAGEKIVSAKNAVANSPIGKATGEAAKATANLARAAVATGFELEAKAMGLTSKIADAGSKLSHAAAAKVSPYGNQSQKNQDGQVGQSGQNDQSSQGHQNGQSN